jgi:hypothetical protein
MKNSKIAIFIDVENLTQWVKDDGSEKLLSELSSIGQIIVRRAYGNWTNQNLFNFQGSLNRSGFELIHNYHPISGKNSSDIQLTIDVMEYALRLNDVEWFVLATGDSDFSPLFRRLREIGKEVIGVGPRSALSESVKTSCSKYIYTDIEKETIKLALDDAIDLTKKALEAFEEPAPFGLLKNVMINIDSAFDEKYLGFKSFSDFLKSIDFIDLVLSDDKKTWLAMPKIMKNDKVTILEENFEKEILSITNEYEKILEEKAWVSIPKKYLTSFYNILIKLPPIPKNEITDTILSKIDNIKITSSDIKRCISLFLKARLFEISYQDNKYSESEKHWQLKKNKNYIEEIDIALIERIESGCIEKGFKINFIALERLLYGKYTNENLNNLIEKGHKLNQEKQY